MKISKLFQKIIQLVIYFLGITAFLYSLIYFAREGSKVTDYAKSGTVNLEVITQSDSILVFATVDTSDFSVPVYPSIFDTIVTLNDTVVYLRIDSANVINRWRTLFFSPNPPGLIFPIEFRHEGQLFRSEITTRLPDTTTFYSILLLQIVRFLLSILFVIVGFGAFLKRRDSGSVRALTLFCYAMSMFFVFAVSALSDNYAKFEIPFNQFFVIILRFLIPFFGAFWLNLHLLFPHPKKFIKNHPFLAYLTIYGPVVFYMFSDNIGLNLPNYFLTFIILFGQTTAGFIILGFGKSLSKDSLEKRQMQLVQWGSGIGLAPLIMLLVAAYAFGDAFSTWKWSLLTVNLSFAAMLLTPLSFVYAFQRYRLLEVEGKLKRGTRFVIATGILMAVLIGVIYLVGELMLRQLGISTRTPTLIASLALAVGLSPALRKVRNIVERRLYPERHKLREMSRDFIHQALAVPDGKTLWGKVESQLKETLKIDILFPVLCDENKGPGFFIHEHDDVPLPFKPNTGLIKNLQTEGRPILVDEAVVSDVVILSLEEELWLMRHKIALIVPMMAQNKLVGFLGIGFKAGGEDYSPEELQILTALSSQLALAGENIRLLEDNLDKKRMEEELKIARKIQRGFLPKEIPDAPGLTIAAKSDFCLEVAGDYYDVLSFRGSGTVLAIGDVAGKGAGAALLMANLQASIRTAAAIGFNVRMGEVVARVNDLIFQNTPPEQYITFFTGYFNPDKLTFTYVNAGHNPPMLIRENEETILLSEGGLILGCLPDQNYEQGFIRIKPGDLIFMYTDGVSEAMNSAEEEFGEKRIEQYIRAHISAPVSDILTGLEREIISFCESAPLMDDFTLLIAKVNELKK